LILTVYAAALVFLGLGWLVSSLAASQALANCFLPLFLLGWIFYSWVANALISSDRS
jgi:hypothetical protein